MMSDDRRPRQRQDPGVEPKTRALWSGPPMTGGDGWGGGGAGGGGY